MGARCEGSSRRSVWTAGLRVLIPAAVVLAVLGTAAFNERSSEETLASPRPAGDLGTLRMVDQRGKVVVVAFGFTSCSDVCPLTLSRMKAAYQLLGEDALHVTMAFVTVDTERDQLERLRAYTASFDTRIVPVFLEGSALADVLTAYGVTVQKRLPDASRYKQLPGGAGYYAVDHTSGFFLADTQGQLRLRVPHNAPPEAFVGHIRKLLAEAPPPPATPARATSEP